MNLFLRRGLSLPHHGLVVTFIEIVVEGAKFTAREGCAKGADRSLKLVLLRRKIHFGFGTKLFGTEREVIIVRLLTHPSH